MRDQPKTMYDLAKASESPQGSPPKPTTGEQEILLPCPFCGSENTGIEPLVGGFVVDCKDCGGGCGTCHDEKSAIEQWNTRKSLREILKERGIDSDKIESEIRSKINPTTTGEWTADSVYRMGLEGRGYIEIADAHNAALAAERRAAEVKWNEAVAARDINHLNRIHELDKQLAAEREKQPKCVYCENPATCFGSYECDTNHGFACDDCCGHGNEDGQCEPLQKFFAQVGTEFNKIQQLREQLAEAQAAIVEHNRHVAEMHTASSDDCYEIPLLDTTALDAAIAEARQPLVSELQNIVNCDLSGMRKDFGDDTDRQFRLWAKSRAKAELEKVKEGKV